MNWIIPALTLGFLGSFHCIGMCGPIALSLPINTTSFFHKVSHLLLYNFGRTLTYSFLGLVFGTIGQTFNFFGIQQYLSITIGVIILMSIFFTSGFAAKHQITASIYKGMNGIKKTLSKLFQRQGWMSVFSIGLLNGLLPCGLVYMGIAGALASGSYTNGALFMFFFGLAIIPVMLSLSFFGNLISLSFKNSIRSITPYVLSVMAVLLILRGLNLGIPYVSPKIQTDTAHVHTTDINCHK